MKVPTTWVTAAALNVTGTLMIMSVPESETEVPATLTVHALLLSGAVFGATGTPSTRAKPSRSGIVDQAHAVRDAVVFDQAGALREE